MRTFILFLLGLVAPGLALAQAPPPVAPPAAVFSVEDAVALALKNNPRLVAVERDVAAARQGTHAARSLSSPQIVFAPALTGAGSDTELLVQQPLEINGARAARTRVAEAQLRGTRADALAERSRVVSSTRAAYYELVRAREQLGLAHDQLEVTQQFDRLTRTQVEIGTRPAVDQIQTGIEVVRARQQAVQARAQADGAQAELNTLMGRPPREAVGTVAASLPPLPPLDEDALLTRALQNRPDIASTQASVETIRQERRAIRAEGVPDLVPQFRATKVTNGLRESGVGVGISLPLLDYGGRSARLRQNEQAAQAGQARVASSQAQARQEVAQALTQLRAAETVLQAYPEGLLDQSRQLLDASRIGYQEGKTSVRALLEAQRTFRAVQTEYINAQVADALARAELERATAADLVAPTHRTPR